MLVAYSEPWAVGGGLASQTTVIFSPVTIVFSRLIMNVMTVTTESHNITNQIDVLILFILYSAN